MTPLFFVWALSAGRTSLNVCLNFWLMIEEKQFDNRFSFHQKREVCEIFTR